METADKIYQTREKLGRLFDAYPENIAFTLNCTYALNLAIKGVVPGRGHIIISSLEHNSAARPAIAKTHFGGQVSIVEVSENDDETIYNLRKRITNKTAAVIFTLGSNVTGQITPFRKIGEICQNSGICFIADGAQAAGIIPISLKKDHINILACPGHKGLYGPAGTGFLISDGQVKITPTIQGGTGSESLSLTQPLYMPDALESGTTNTSGNIALGAGIDFINTVGMDNIYKHETALCEQFMAGLSDLSTVKIYRNPKIKHYLPIVLFNIKGQLSSDVAALLSEKGFALRGGLHCSGLAHKALGTAPEGAVRFSPSYFNTESEVNALISVIKEITKNTH
jgi:selenocysteine lyase/cysteine desulfurase